MTGILGFAVAQGPLYAGTLCECLAVLAEKKACFDANTGDVTQVVVTRFPTGNLLQCMIRSGNSARLFLTADRIGNNPQDFNFGSSGILVAGGGE